VTETDALDRLLQVAEAEGALTAGGGLAGFAEGLRARAGLVLDERVRPLERRIEDLEVAVAALEKENAWRGQAMAALEVEIGRLKAEAEALRAERDRSSSAHEALLAHHRDVVSRAVERFATAAQLPFWKLRECRALLNEAAALFGRERA